MTRKERRKGMARQPALREGLHKPMAFTPVGLSKLRLPESYGIPERVQRLQVLRVGNYGQF